MNSGRKEPRELSLREVYELSSENPPEYFRVMNHDKLAFRRSWLACWTLTSDPDVVQHILLNNSQNYRKSLLTRLLLEPPLGKYTLFTSEGERWKQQRRLAAPAFAVRSIERFAPMMAEESHRLLRKWDRYRDVGHEINVQHEMAEVTLKIIMRAMFSRASEDGYSMEIAQAVHKFARVRIGMIDLLGVPKWVPRVSNIRLRSAKKLLNDTAKGIIMERRRSGVKKNDLLGLLMDSVDEQTGRGMTVAQIQDEVRSYFVAGYETTATTLTWVFYVLHRYPEVEAKLHHELDSVLNGRMPELSDLADLPYTLQVIQETMRLYTVVPSIGRQAIAEDEVNGTRIPKNAVIQVNIWLMHRDPKLWDEPETFKPERFANTNNPGRHRFSYLPFGGGPRICIGSKFSLLEAQLILASVAQFWRLKTSEEYVVEPFGQIVLQPKDGLPMIIERRK